MSAVIEGLRQQPLAQHDLIVRQEKRADDILGQIACSMEGHEKLRMGQQQEHQHRDLQWEKALRALREELRQEFMERMQGLSSPSGADTGADAGALHQELAYARQQVQVQFEELRKEVTLRGMEQQRQLEQHMQQERLSAQSPSLAQPSMDGLVGRMQELEISGESSKGRLQQMHVAMRELRKSVEDVRQQCVQQLCECHGKVDRLACDLALLAAVPRPAMGDASGVPHNQTLEK